MTAQNGSNRQPLLFGTIAAVIGIALAVILFGGGTGPTTSASPSPGAVASPSAGPSATLAAVATGAPTAENTAAPPTEAPTVAPTIAATLAPTLTPTATPNTNPVIVLWETPGQEDCTNSTAGSVHVKWSVKRASGVSISIDGPGIYQSYAGLTGEVDLPYGCDNDVLQHTYTLRTIGGTGPADSDTNVIKTRAPSITSFTMGVPDCTGPQFVGISMSFEIRAATGAELKRDGAVYSTYNTKATDDIVQYDCTKEFMTFRLTTTGGYGPAAHKTITVNRPPL